MMYHGGDVLYELEGISGICMNSVLKPYNPALKGDAVKHRTSSLRSVRRALAPR